MLILPDMNNDGVPEVLVPHGGDPKIPPEVALSVLSLSIRYYRTITDNNCGDSLNLNQIVHCKMEVIS